MVKDLETGSDHKDDVGHHEHSAGHNGGIDLSNYVYVPDSPEEKRLVRKIDLHLIPMLWFMYIMNYVS